MINTEEIRTKDESEKPDSIAQAASQIKRKRGGHPRLPLKKTLELSTALYEIGQGEQVRRLKVFDHLGKSADSGPSRTLVTASSAYGLTKGGYQADYLQLTDNGAAIVTADSQNKKYKKAFEILCSNDVFSSFIDYWKNKVLPDDDIASDWLERNQQLSSQDAKAIWEVIKANIFDYNLTEQLSGKQVIIPIEAAVETLNKKNEDSHEGHEVIDPTQNGIGELSVINTKEIRASKTNILEPELTGFERNYTYGTAHMVFPAKMKQIELDKMKTVIEGLVEIVDE